MENAAGATDASSRVNVPFCDLAAVNAYYSWPLKEAYNRVMSRGQYILGPEVEAFEEEWAAYCGRKYAVGFGNGTEALIFMMAAHGIRPADRVIVPAHTCIATWLAVSALGAIPMPVDVDPVSFNLNTKTIDTAGQYAAILAVHMYGRTADMDRLRAFSEAMSVPLLIDAAQAHGIKGEFLGDAAAFSFYPTKNLGALGDGGAVVTDSEETAQMLRALRNLGSIKKDVHVLLGGNSRLDELQAAFLRAKLPGLDDANGRREHNAMLYGLPRAHSAWHQCVITSGQRDSLRKRLAEQDVTTMVHYPTPPHLQPCYAGLGYKVGSFPIAESIAHTAISLPCGPELSHAQVRYVAGLLADSRVAA